MKKPVKTPANRNVLAKYVDAYAREHGTDVARVRRWISFMALAGALQEAAFADGRPKFVIKGGVALELRLRHRTDYVALREACAEVFGRRATHDWPPVFDPAEEWRDAFSRMAREIDLTIADLDEALRAVRSFVERIASA